MSANIINKSGSTSTFIPGGTGSSGKRAAVTFYGTDNEEPISDPITFILNDNSVTISNIYGSSITPDIGDCIVYSEPNNTYLLYITGKKIGGYTVNISSIWNTQSSQSGDQETDISNIELNVTCVNNIAQIYRGFKSNIADRILASSDIDEAGFTGEKDPNSLYVNSVCGFTFLVTSLNSLPLGEYKLQIEFITDWTSPGMDTRIAKKFQTQQLYSGLSNYPNTGEKCTLRGYITNYSCKGSTEKYSIFCPNCGGTTNIHWEKENGRWVQSCNACHYTSSLPKNPEVVSENFDDEKLDNFEVTIKDYSDGIGEQSYRTTTFIPIDVLRNAYNAGHPYKCLLYLYVNGTNGSKEKIFMRDMSSTFNIAVNEADSSVYGYGYITNNNNIIHDPITHGERYAGTEHSGQNTNMIHLKNFEDEFIGPADDIIPYINETQQDIIINPYIKDPREYNDDVYVNNIMIQKHAGSGNWCHCTYDSVNHKLKYKATSDNDTGSIRYAYFVHTTTDDTLSYGPNAGSLAMPQWIVTVMQSTKTKPNGTNSVVGEKISAIEVQ